jgi:hypothetical protein
MTIIARFLVKFLVLVVIHFAIHAVAVFSAALAHGDDGSIDQTICNQLALGQSPGQISDELRHGDARWTPNRAIPRVWSALPDCPSD